MKYFLAIVAVIDSRLQIRRMQDILAQMQEKLKATGQVGGGGLRGRVGSLGNDLDSADVEKKRNSIIDVWSRLISGYMYYPGRRISREIHTYFDKSSWQISRCVKFSRP